MLGNDRTQEHETLDRTDTALPGLQEPFAMQVFALGKPVVMVLTNGGALAIDNLMSQPNAIVEAFNPGVGGAVRYFAPHNQTVYVYEFHVVARYRLLTLSSAFRTAGEKCQLPCERPRA